MNRILSYLMLLICFMSISGCGQDPLELERLKQKDKQVKENMRTAQIAAERYAADHGSINYPVAIDDMFKTYFPGGEAGRRPAQVGPINPFNGLNAFPAIGPLRGKNAEEIRRMKRFKIPRGTIEYIPLDGGRGYAIIGGAHDDLILVDDLNPDQNLVYSNN